MQNFQGFGSQIHFYSSASFQKYYYDPMLLYFFPPCTKTNHVFPPKENYMNRYSKIQIRNHR